ncbi:MarR family winged helix-turn-helix transcriptional regulator [Halorientalis regularis]|uniref:Transcriptional regulator PadR-like family protein n=1 Tax=Halorientalis regularis TaxID=660518 RepID=A0A1G7TAU5_9EURY|nr:MarR family winged helix-turn-helix transcriptional regulator [Halorientalis regularis]SDG32426.1 Transcriptional regulator PadR-like family protein [Halorientalis regularis]
MHDLTGFQRDLLYVIAGLDEPQSLTLKGETEIHHGHLYSNLDTLVDKGLIEKESKDRRISFYSATKRGHRGWEQQYLDW